MIKTMGNLSRSGERRDRGEWKREEEGKSATEDKGRVRGEGEAVAARLRCASEGQRPPSIFGESRGQRPPSISGNSKGQSPLGAHRKYIPLTVSFLPKNAGVKHPSLRRPSRSLYNKHSCKQAIRKLEDFDGLCHSSRKPSCMSPKHC